MLIFFIIFCFATAIQLGFGIFFLKYAASRCALSGAPPEKLPGVSIIICARNEAGNLRHFLPLVLAQDYPGHLWEVIVVNDASDDGSAALLHELQKENHRLKIVTIEAYASRSLPGKKFALDKGIRAASFETLLLTDADCRPATAQWLRTLARYKAASGNAIVLGYGKYRQTAGFLNRFIRWETAHTARQYVSLAESGRTYMGVGRNLMYEKQLYLHAASDTGFWKTYARLPSGDDDLLVAGIASRSPAGSCLAQEAHTVSLPESRWKEWFRQKKRHLSTGKYYPSAIKRILGLYAFSHGLFWLLFTALLVTAGICIASKQAFPSFLPAAFFCGCGRILFYWISAAGWYRMLHEKKLILFYPAGDFCWAVYNLIFASYIFWRNKQEWK